MKTPEALRTELSEQVAKDGIEAVAKRLDVTWEYVAMLVSGRAPISRGIARSMGYRVVVGYEEQGE
jgi:hypothetical protein